MQAAPTPDNSPIASRTTDHARMVQRLFGGIVPRYDLMNTIMSMGFDRRWRRLTAETGHPQGARVLDLGTGTGELAAEMARHGAAEVVGLDFAWPMLAVASARQPRRLAAEGVLTRLAWLAGDAQHLPFAGGAFDVAAAAFVLRNLADLDQGLREIRRVLRPGGQLLSLDMVAPSSRLFRLLYRPYFWGLMPAIGGLISRQPDAYRYLPRSIDGFLTAEGLAERLLDAGFTRVTHRPLGLGSVALHQATSPEA